MAADTNETVDPLVLAKNLLIDVVSQMQEVASHPQKREASLLVLQIAQTTALIDIAASLRTLADKLPGR